MKYVVARAEDILPGERLIAEVAGRSIGIFNIGGAFYALRNQCPHAGAPVCLGRIGGRARSKSPGEIEYDMDGEVIRCPWHHWEFDIKSGESVFDPHRVQIKAYETEVVRAGQAGANEVPEERADIRWLEKYETSVEGAFVLVDI